MTTTTPKLIVTDLDGTLLTPDSKITARTASVIQKCRDAGHLFIFATGRPPRSTVDFVKRLAPDGGVVNNGTYVYFRGNVILEQTITLDFAGEMIGEFLSHGLRFDADFGAYGLTNHPGYLEWQGWGDTMTRFCDFADCPAAGWRGVQKFAVEADDYRLLEEIISFEKYGCRLIPSYTNEWHMVMPEGADKARGVRAICEYAKVDVADAICFGDDCNDIGMLRECGLGVAMENAGDIVKGAARAVAPPNTEDGVAVWLEENLLNI
ncbi:MAG: Cof-type HAD-IIB family hydrolase [Defluviitaleaceae bacterium]|nr:Cof-type HAD-IIB family hydrolase [Defluviitaleaceae bacterium]